MNAFVESTHNARTDLVRTVFGQMDCLCQSANFRSLREAGSHVVPACVTSKGCGRLETFLMRFKKFCIL